MSTWDEEERESFMIHGVPFKATAKQCREILKQIRATSVYQDWHMADEEAGMIQVTPELNKYSGAESSSYLRYVDNVCCRQARLNSEVTNLLIDIIDKVTKES